MGFLTSKSERMMSNSESVARRQKRGEFQTTQTKTGHARIDQVTLVLTTESENRLASLKTCDFSCSVFVFSPTRQVGPDKILDQNTVK